MYPKRPQALPPLHPKTGTTSTVQPPSPHLARRVEALLRAIEALPPGEYPLTITREESGFRWEGLPARSFPPRNT